MQFFAINISMTGARPIQAHVDIQLLRLTQRSIQRGIKVMVRTNPHHLLLLLIRRRGHRPMTHNFYCIVCGIVAIAEQQQLHCYRQCTIPNITSVTTFGQGDSWVQNLLSQLIYTSVAVDNDNNDISHLSTSLE